MEKILKQLQEIQIEAFKMKVATFYISNYHWADTPESPDAIIVRTTKSEDDDDAFSGSFYRDTSPEEVASIISHLKIYLGL